MPVISFPEIVPDGLFFAFLENDILLKNGSLISKAEFEFLVRQKSASDWYSEPNLFYAALSLSSGSTVPSGCSFIPVRQFFHLHPDTAHLAARALSLLKQRRNFLFCPSCKSRLTDDKTESAKRCPGCGALFFPRIEPATITLVSRKDEILLVKNKNSAYKKFACVSGFVEQGESLEQCVAREIKEETNLSVSGITYRGSQSWPFPNQLMVAFTAEYESGELAIQESEILEAAWFKRNALPPASELPPPGSVAYNLINGLF